MNTPYPADDGDLLVIGYGNTLRQDDRAGPLVAGTIESYGLHGVRTLVCAQLSPEHAEAVARAREVVMVDATSGPCQAPTLRRVEAANSPQVTTHAVEPPTLLALARDVYGRVPPAWLLTVPAERLGFGTDISETTRHGVEVAVGKVVKLAHRKPAAGSERAMEATSGTSIAPRPSALP
jgi:hydrogenase maturation protease